MNVFLYSIANKKRNQVIDDLIGLFLESEFIPEQDKRILRHCLEVGANGQYPSPEYFGTFYPVAAFTFSNLSEIQTYVGKVLDRYKKSAIEKKVITLINDTTNASGLLTGLDDLVSGVDKADESGDSFSDFKPILYSDGINRPESKGLMCGIPEIDDLTNGFQEGSIATIAAFTGQGKSTLTSSILFRNALAGKKCVLISLEMAPEVIWPQFQARFLYQCKGMQVDSQSIQMHKLSKEEAEYISGFDDDFRSQICSNLVILDESVLNKQLVLSVKGWQRLFRSIEKKLGGLDLVAFDHVGQFELLFPDKGNIILKQIQSAIKTYKCESGNRPASIWCCQCNREGNRRAAKAGGKYDLQAIGDLNEVERSSSYVMFLFTDAEHISIQETLVSLVKHRLGGVLPDPATVQFHPELITVGLAVDPVTLDDGALNDLDASFSGGDFDGF